MPKFSWEGKTRTGAIQKGDMEAASEAVVTAQLRRQGIMPSKIKARGKGLDMEIKIPGMQPKVTTKDLVVFTRQFATMIDAGLPLVQCLDILGKQQDNKTFKKILTTVKESVESGSTFADALKKHP
jgi:type IV pilus assembly protein PilC